jgi:hypothetical protein
MAPKFANVYQFKITLKDSKPPIWRRIQVPENYSFWDLHVAIQDAMGWMDYHLHVFEIGTYGGFGSIEIGIPEANEHLKSVKEKISKYFSPTHPKVMYVYDFGDDWEHTILLEKIVPADPAQSYPLCLAGKRACPPEDCGGLYGYYNMLEILSHPKHPQYQDYLSWLDGDFDPDAFDPKEVVFDDPKKRQRLSGL